jgi:23S rRNA pseudouridine1911/1915/1917 synthase
MARTKVVPAELAGPVDRVIRGLFDASWGKARAWIAGGKVRVAGTVVTETTARVRAGTEVTLDEAARRPRAKELGDGDVVYADAQVIVVSKPAGLSTVPYDDTETDTLDLRVRGWLERRGLAPQGARPTLGIVHRLDKETTGLVVFTRTWLAKQALTAQFRRHTVHRRYFAIAHGDVPAGGSAAFSSRTGATGFAVRRAVRAGVDPPMRAKPSPTSSASRPSPGLRSSVVGSRRGAPTRSGSI